MRAARVLPDTPSSRPMPFWFAVFVDVNGSEAWIEDAHVPFVVIGAEKAKKRDLARLFVSGHNRAERGNRSGPAGGRRQYGFASEQTGKHPTVGRGTPPRTLPTNWNGE